MAKGAICGSIFAFQLSENKVFTPHGLLVAKKKKKSLKRKKEEPIGHKKILKYKKTKIKGFIRFHHNCIVIYTY